MNDGEEVRVGYTKMEQTRLATRDWPLLELTLVLRWLEEREWLDNQNHKHCYPQTHWS